MIIKNVDATMKSFECSIDGHKILLDHLRQLNLYNSINTIGEPGNITLTYDMYKMLSNQMADYNPIGKQIIFEILDFKSKKPVSYKGIITSYHKAHSVKQDSVVLFFDKEKYLKLSQVVQPKSYTNVTVMQVLQDFLSSNDMKLSSNPTSNRNRGTFWEEFTIPMNVPTLNFLLTEISKDRLVYFANPQDESITVCSYSDVENLTQLHKNNPDYVIDGFLANFDETKEQWKKNTFIHAKQIDTRSPWRISDWSFNNTQNLFEDSTFDYTYYSGLKYEGYFNENSSLEANNFQGYSPETYNGQKLKNIQIEQYAGSVLRDNKKVPKSDTNGYEANVQHRIVPRYMYYRMREGYADNIKWQTANLSIAGSIHMLQPLAAVQITYFENAMNANKKVLAKGDPAQSGLYLIQSASLKITGNNLLNELTLIKPYS